MSIKNYGNFVRPASQIHPRVNSIQEALNGDEARKLYLEEVRDVKEPVPATDEHASITTERSILKHNLAEILLTDKDLFVSVENDDVNAVARILDNSPDKITTVDDYGWSLLMIACQANAIESAKELLKRGVDTSIRDKAGNSAQSLVIKNKNLVLANILLDHKSKVDEVRFKNKRKNAKHKKDKFRCEICNNTFPDKQQHLSSTIHNINASKGRKMPTNYVIPQSNKGYQIMLKVGWDRDTGLGPAGSGNKYPIKAVQKMDRKGLGHKKTKEEESKRETAKQANKRTFNRDYQHSRRMEINFRREFY